MAASTDPALKACELLPKLLHYRGLELVAEPLRPAHVKAGDLEAGFTPIDSIRGVVHGMGSWQILARRKSDPGGLVWLVVLTESSKEATVLKNWRSLLGNAVSSAEREAKAHGAEGKATEVVVIAPPAMAAKSNTTAELAAARKEQPGVEFYLHSFDAFSCVVPEHMIVPRHSIASDEEARAFMGLMQIKPGDLPIIKADDPAVVWIGARRGQYVKVMRRSSTAGAFTPVIRLVC